MHRAFALQRLRTLAAAKVSFAFESTLSSRTFALFLARCKAQGYQVHIYYVALPSAELATQRVALRSAASMCLRTARRRYWNHWVSKSHLTGK